MSFLSRLRTAQPGQPQQDGDAASEIHGLSEQEVARAQELHEALDADPNDSAAFGELAELVRRNASAVAVADPLTAGAEASTSERDADLAVWSLAEELASQPKAWFPLLELARLSLPAGDVEGAVRRLHSAVEREESGAALTEALRLLREHGRSDEAYNLGVAQWKPASHGATAGRELILAALEGERPLDAKRILADLEEVQGADQAQVEELRSRIQVALLEG